MTSLVNETCSDEITHLKQQINILSLENYFLKQHHKKDNLKLLSQILEKNNKIQFDSQTYKKQADILQEKIAKCRSDIQELTQANTKFTQIISNTTVSNYLYTYNSDEILPPISSLYQKNSFPYTSPSKELIEKIINQSNIMQDHKQKILEFFGEPLRVSHFCKFLKNYFLTSSTKQDELLDDFINQYPHHQNLSFSIDKFFLSQLIQIFGEYFNLATITSYIAESIEKLQQILRSIIEIRRLIQQFSNAQIIPNRIYEWVPIIKELRENSTNFSQIILKEYEMLINVRTNNSDINIINNHPSVPSSKLLTYNKYLTENIEQIVFATLVSGLSYTKLNLALSLM